MCQSRFTALQQGLNATAKKVFAVVPIADYWTSAQIVAEMRRQGSAIDGRVAGGCIAALLSAGLVVEGKPGHYTRVKVSESGAKGEDPTPRRVVEFKKGEQGVTNDKSAGEAESIRDCQARGALGACCGHRHDAQDPE